METGSHLYISFFVWISFGALKYLAIYSTEDHHQKEKNYFKKDCHWEISVLPLQLIIFRLVSLKYMRTMFLSNIMYEQNYALFFLSF